MKSLMILMLVTVSVNAFAVENKDVECSVTRYTTEIGADGMKKNEKTVGIKNQILKWAEASENKSQDARFEVDGMAMSASLSSSKCWDDDRMVECNERMLFLSVYDRANDSHTSTYYNLNSAAAAGIAPLVIQNSRGHHSISCRQLP